MALGRCATHTHTTHYGGCRGEVGSVLYDLQITYCCQRGRNKRMLGSCFLLVVIDGLDFLKKENAGARDSIRYLEAEFKKGNR